MAAWALGVGTFFAEFVRLMLVLAGAALGAHFFGGELGSAPFVAQLIPLAFFAFYAAFVLIPARDLVSGWLGMLAGRVPKRFDERAENFGRGLSGVLFTFGWVVVLVATTHRHSHDASGEAFAFAFILLATVVFGAGTAVPRLWFALRNPPARGTDLVPELLQRASKRASRFFYGAFLGIGLGLAAAHAAAFVKPPPPPIVLPEGGDVFEQGSLCARPTASCPAEHRVHFLADIDGAARLELFRTEDAPLCRIAPDGAWPATTVWPPALNADPRAWSVKLELPVRARTRLGFRLVPPAGAFGCNFALEIKQPLAGGEP